MAEWFKRSWAQLLVLLGVALGALAVFFTRKRDVPSIPPPPATPPVEIPPVNTAPATTYVDTKAQPVDVTKNGVKDVIVHLNARHK